MNVYKQLSLSILRLQFLKSFLGKILFYYYIDIHITYYDDMITEIVLDIITYQIYKRVIRKQIYDKMKNGIKYIYNRFMINKI